jgi:hypothetical protein
MGFTLNQVIPWGRSFAEYVAMFALSTEDLGQKILGCGDGPASFNADLTRQGGNVISVDPLYQFSAPEIRNRIDAVYPQVMEQVRLNQGDFVWTQIKTVEELGQIRMAAMERFLEDYSQDYCQNDARGGDRYCNAALPTLPFASGTFDLALCSHFLFAYSEQLSYEFHLRSLQELCRVAREVRIFPILELGGARSRHVDQTIDQLRKLGYRCSLETVAYEFQRGGNQMLRVKPCQI